MSDAAEAGRLAPLAPGFATTREALARVAAQILARRRSDMTGRIGLRPSPGGFATPAFGDDVEVLRTDGATLLIERAGTTTTHPLTTLDDLAAAAGVDLAGPLSLGGDPPPLGDPSERLAVDERAARALGDWFAFTTSVFGAVLGTLGAAAAPSVVQLWPEHFDVACDVAWGPGEDQRANLGGSPGDGHHPEPYLYVGPWGPERPGRPEYWNAPFGATLGYGALRAAGHLEASHAAAVQFLRDGVDQLVSG